MELEELSVVEKAAVLSLSLIHIFLSLMLLLWMNDRRQEMGVLVSLGIGKPSLIAQYRCV